MIASHPSAQSICDALGRAEMSSRLNVTLTAISNAAVAGTFPPSWFSVLDTMCAEQGISCPRSLFRFRGANEGSSRESAA